MFSIVIVSAHTFLLLSLLNAMQCKKNDGKMPSFNHKGIREFFIKKLYLFLSLSINCKRRSIASSSGIFFSTHSFWR